MAIDADLILRQATDIQRLALTEARAKELAEETQALLDLAREASDSAAFEDAPAQFLALLVELRDRQAAS
jgi:hypothetical protein